jgi:hypothetical protein
MDTWEGEDGILALSIFETTEVAAVSGMVSAWLEQHADRVLDRVLAWEMSVGAGITLLLADGVKAFMKVWPRSANPTALAAQTEVQASLARNGFPAPGVLVAPRPLGPGNAVLMAFDRRGVPTDVRVPGVREAMARALVRLLREAEPFLALAGLPTKELPSDDATWRRPHNALFDFEATAGGAEWIDAVGGEALATMRAGVGRLIVGHHDWSAKNMRMGASEIAVVYDWDSVFVDRETFVVGSAAAHFPVTWELPVPETPTPGEIAEFIRSYEEARGQPFTHRELVEIAASATYARAYKARCEHAIDMRHEKCAGSSRQDLRARGPYTAAMLEAAR